MLSLQFETSCSSPQHLATLQKALGGLHPCFSPMYAEANMGHRNRQPWVRIKSRQSPPKLGSESRRMHRLPRVKQ